MKKLIAMLLALTLIASLTACGGTTVTESPKSSTPAKTEEKPAEQQSGAQASEAEGFCFTLEDVKLVPGADFDPSVLPEAASIYEVPSCAIVGTDNVYNYETVEVTAFDDGNGEIIYEIFIVDANTPTDEGLYISDSLEQVNTIYGTDRTENGNELIYTKGNTMLVLLMENDAVTSITFRAVTE